MTAVRSASPVTTPTSASIRSTSVDRAVVMGIVNVTPDSFSDAGRHLDHDAAVNHAWALIDQGADLVDVGGESTRPGAGRVDPDVELARVIPVVRTLAAAGVMVSVDTSRASVAAAALEAGAQCVNDVTGGRGDPAMAAVMAGSDALYVAMHWRAPSAVMHRFSSYADVVHDVAHELQQRVEALTGEGVDPGRLIVDPGLGFAKSAEQDWEIIARLGELCAALPPLLVGASRKSFLADACGPGTSPVDRDGLTAAISLIAARAGVWGVRVHAPALTLHAVRGAARLNRVDAVARGGRR